MQIRERNEEGMGRGRKKTGTINQTGVKGSKSKRSKIPPQSLFFFLFSAPALLAARGSPLTARSFARGSIALNTLGKERDCSQSRDD